MSVRGNFRILILYDVADHFDLVKLKQAIGPATLPVKPFFSRRTPEYIRLVQAPIAEAAEDITLPTGERLACVIKYYSYAVVAVQLTTPFSGEWDSLIPQAARWIDSSELEPLVRAMVVRRLQQLRVDSLRPINHWLVEDYLVSEIYEITEGGTSRPTTADLVAAHGETIVRVIRGETHTLSPKTVEYVLQSSLSYFDCDLVVINSAGALIYDAEEDAAAATSIIEYAKMQLLEFRYYDNLLSKLLSDVYVTLDQKRNPLFSRWTIPRDAKRLNTIRLDAMELTELVDNAIKFVSDAFYARVYRMAEQRMGVSEYRELVDEKLKTIGELYDFMIDQYDEQRSFVLEVAVAILALLDVIFLFRGK